MGWSIGYDSNWKRDIGYGVPAVCDHPKCNEEIHRGLAYVCGGKPYVAIRVVVCFSGFTFPGKNHYLTLERAMNLEGAEYVKIIGNIHQNLELLKKSDDSMAGKKEAENGNRLRYRRQECGIPIVSTTSGSLNLINAQKGE